LFLNDLYESYVMVQINIGNGYMTRHRLLELNFTITFLSRFSGRLSFWMYWLGKNLTFASSKNALSNKIYTQKCIFENEFLEMWGEKSCSTGTRMYITNYNDFGHSIAVIV
jgi:hypothetical protein